MSFCNHLRKRAQLIWNAQLTHPFVVALGKGTLPERKFRYYILQDARFLGDLARVFAAAAQRAPDAESTLRFTKLVEETILTERALHALATSFYRALWQHRRDISDSATIHTLMAEAGLHDAIDAAAADSITRSWHNAWLERGVGSVPELVRRDGEALIGLVDRDILHGFLAFR